jgi:hypothetical protein
MWYKVKDMNCVFHDIQLLSLMKMGINVQGRRSVYNRVTFDVLLTVHYGTSMN